MRFKGLAKSGGRDIIDIILELDSGTLFSDFMDIAKKKLCDLSRHSNNLFDFHSIPA